MHRVILHCDLNSFYASVEIKHRPELKGKAVAVCGSTDSRHGIVLAKSEEAKKYGVSTGEAVWQAVVKCPHLIIIQPQYDGYLKYSRMAREIYESYTDLVEPFGIDEAWLDVTGSARLFGDGEKIARTIKERIKNELGLTISVGVSFNKVFAKLGSDLKKPDAVTVIPYDGFGDIIHRLPVSAMIGIGESTKKHLKEYGIFTLGELAETDVRFLKQKLGKCGYFLWRCANGLDNSPVAPIGSSVPLKSVGHGTTTVCDLHSDDEVWRVLYGLTQDISRRLRENGLTPTGVRVSVRTNELEITQYQGKLNIPSRCFDIIADKAFELFRSNYNWKKPIRSLAVTAIDLISDNTPIQLNFTADPQRLLKTEQAEMTIEKIRKKYGKKIINMCSLYQKPVTPDFSALSKFTQFPQS